MNNAHVGRNNLEIAECGLSPAQKGIALLIALELKKCIGMKSVDAGEFIHLHGMVNHQFCGLQRIDQGRVAAHSGHGIAHGRQVNDRRHTCEILHEHARGSKRNFP